MYDHFYTGDMTVWRLFTLHNSSSVIGSIINSTVQFLEGRSRFINILYLNQIDYFHILYPNKVL